MKRLTRWPVLCFIYGNVWFICLGDEIITSFIMTSVIYLVVPVQLSKMLKMIYNNSVIFNLFLSVNHCFVICRI